MKKILRTDWIHYQDEINKSGIYKITNKSNGKFYIGSASHIRERWNIHLHRLRNNNHHSKHLQNSFNKYGEESFTFHILDIIEGGNNVELKNKLLEREQFYLDSLNPCDRAIGYNNPSAQSMLGYKHSDETKRKNSKAQLKHHADNPGIHKGKNSSMFGRYGKLHHGSMPILQFDLDNNFIKRWDCINDIVRDFNKPVRSNILSCCNGRYKQAYKFIWKKE